MLTDLAGGHVQVALSDYGSIKPFFDAGKVRLLAVATEKRLPTLPDVPTFSEVGLHDFPISIWHAVTVPVGTPQAVVDALAAAPEEAVSVSTSPRPSCCHQCRYFLHGQKKGRCVREFSGRVMAKHRPASQHPTRLSGCGIVSLEHWSTSLRVTLSPPLATFPRSRSLRTREAHLSRFSTHKVQK